MYCENCGNKLSDEAVFCAECGQKIIRDDEWEIETSSLVGIQQLQEKNKRINSQWILVGIVAVAVVIGTGIFLNRNSDNDENTEIVMEENNSKEDSEIDNIQEEKNTENEQSEVVYLEQSEEQVFLKMIQTLNTSGENMEKINVYENNYSPGKRNKSYQWDGSLFYTLEEISPTSNNDGKINSYNIEKKQLLNAVTNNLMEYEIYRNPNTNAVNKIVSIEYKGSMLEITDYYYNDNGKVNFIFVRDDINYVPSYATPDKSGQRYYFCNDTLVKWRMITNGSQTNYIIGNAEKERGGNAGSVILYSELNTDMQNEYDAMEIKMINAAYNTYNIVLNAKGISNIVGYVYDNYGQPLSGATVLLYTEEYTNPIYQYTTSSDGIYRIIVPSDARNYWIEVVKEGYQTTTLYNIHMNEQMLGVYQETIYLINNNLNTNCNTKLIICDAFNVSYDYDGMLRLSDAEVKIRKGIKNKSGEVYTTGRTDINGVLQLSLPAGMYTAEVKKVGYAVTYYTIAVTKNDIQIEINTTPVLNEGEIRIVLTWGSYPDDLDSHLFTPYDSSSGDTTYHIWYGNKNDFNMNNLDVDDTTGYGPETMTINRLGNGLYKYYVADFTNCSYRNLHSTDMSFSNATVNIYTSEGLAYTFHVPYGCEGVIWEVFEIRNKTIIPIQRYYHNIDDKTWWNNEK